MRSKFIAAVVSPLIAALAIGASVPAANAAFNGKIAFTSPPPSRGLESDIFVIDEDGSGQTRLTSAPGDDSEPAWSPDGTRVAFRSRRDHFRGEIYVMNAGGSNQVRLTENSHFDRLPSWSPDGTKILFQQTRCPTPSCDDEYLLTMNAV